MIDVHTVWELIHLHAIKAQITDARWYSLEQHHEYRIMHVDIDHLIIQRQAPHQPQILTQHTLEQAAMYFNEHDCHVQRGHLIDPTVAEETAFVFLHPQLTWQTEGGIEFIAQLPDL